ncbi:1-acyl-sn-glycerol-3-phosphate acyltransferase [Roseomonas frigidaquae]|uniref:1-acyl-sn-glycerol-3-phosphate acyltransferase n=1 Tax=Falsiroseomonas frigidaquae TaxID=487318 RepID=A0ABX1F5T6_9PROT|nr:lysophospholipid acyltransferase family protein [Falsiroseomonas frigidaquae]NKE47735.1 1-acyl-sn-glycerol-3-phosphate acyltransferase [Falsiroseomonas frigidaquae]
MTKIEAAVQQTRSPPRQGWLLAAYYRIAFYFCVLVWLLSCLAWSLPALLLVRIVPKRPGERIGQFMIMLGFRWFLFVMRATGVLRVDLSPLDVLRRDGGLVIAPNHPTMLDAVLIISRLPRVVCITKASLWSSWTLGGGIRMAGYMPNDAPLPMIRRAGEAVRGGSQLLIFPEGSRTGRPPVDRLHRSFALMARAAQAPVQALLIEADSPYLSRGWPLFRRPVLPLVYRIRLGERFEVGENTEDCVARLERHFRAELPPRQPA